MSQEETLSRKDRKALRDAERQKKGKKRKHDETEEPEAVPTCDADETAEESVKPKESKKRKSVSEGDETAAAATENTTTEEQPKKKRRRKGKSEDEKPSKNRFIVFVGNLPYKTTDSSLDKHFAKLKPFTLRHRTDPKTKKSKGFAFLEFENYDRMKTCLKLYHHSMFDPEAIERGEAPIEPGTGTESLPDQNAAFKGRHHQKKKETARRINVELTAGGGGGNSEERKEKIKVKNAKLDEERKRRAEEERKAKEKEAKKDAKAGKVQGEKKTIVKELQEKARKVEEEAGAGEEDSHGMHPSRMRMLHR